MFVREYSEHDLDALRAIHAAQGFDYAFPDLNNPLFVTKLVLSDEIVAPPLRAASVSSQRAPESENAELKLGATQERTLGASESPRSRGAGTGNCSLADGRRQILGAALLRLTAEAYLLLDPRAGTPRERWQWLLALHEAARRDAWRRGLQDVHAWLPPPIASKFGRRLERLGWVRDDSWAPFCLRLEGK